MKSIQTLIAIALILSGFAHAEEVPCPPELLPIREIITRAIDNNAIPSAAIIITRDGKTLWAEGFGYADIEKQTKATSDTIYLLASVSKPITATGLMTLVDAGKIDISKPANDYLPNTKITANIGNADDITVSTLLHHTSGLGTHYSFFYDGPPPSMDETIRRFAHTVYPPGERYNYCNLGYGILEYMTQVVSGTSWTGYMERTIYDPLGMTGTSDHVRPERIADRAEIYSKDSGGNFVIQPPYDFDHPGASAIWSTATDLTRFLQMHINGGELDGTRILSPESARAMLTPAGPHAQYGLGWSVPMYREPRYFDHTGGMPGVSTIIGAWPDQKTTLVLLTNTSAASIIGPVRDKTEELLLPPVKKKRPPRPDRPEKIKDFQPIGAWTGHIQHFDGPIPVTLTIRANDDISIEYNNTPPQSLDRAFINDQVRGRTTQTIRIQDQYTGPPTIAFTLTPTDQNTLQGPIIVEAPGRYLTTRYATLTRQPRIKNED